MNKQLKRKWIKALLSGEYKQGFAGHLLEAGKYCCLGVLREIADLNDARSWGEYGQFLSPDQLKEFGLSPLEQEALADLNDKGVPFEVIAGLIEETL